MDVGVGVLILILCVLLRTRTRNPPLLEEEERGGPSVALNATFVSMSV